MSGHTSFEIRIHGRGGQGAVTAADMLSVAAFDEGDGVREVCERQPAGETRAVGALGGVGRRDELGREAVGRRALRKPVLRVPLRRGELARLEQAQDLVRDLCDRRRRRTITHELAHGRRDCPSTLVRAITKFSMSVVDM